MMAREVDIHAVSERSRNPGTIPHVDDALAFVKGLSKLPHQDIKYQLDKLREYRTALFDMCPFQVGDHVALRDDYEIDPKTSWGWLGYERMMTKGATAVVREIDWLRIGNMKRGAFVIRVLFDVQFRDSTLGGERRTFTKEPDERGLFSFWHPDRYWVLASDAETAGERRTEQP